MCKEIHVFGSVVSKTSSATNGTEIAHEGPSLEVATQSLRMSLGRVSWVCARYGQVSALSAIV
eukprot:278206-Amphidinium_carterae.1